MLDDLKVDQAIRLAILNLCVILHDCGISEVHVGGLMRILGVSNQHAQAHDDERLIIDEKFIKYVDQINQPRSSDQVLH
jgi:hypothetical protein